MIGKSIIELDSVDSTSNYIAKGLDEGDYEWGTAILAHFQTNGRGQRAAHWQSDNGQNLTFSFALPLKGIDSRAFFSVSRAICLSLVKTISSIVEGDIRIKWPNDILVDRQKIAGILIENRLGKNPAAICGIGLNINQSDFRDLPHATSLKKVSGKKFEVRLVLLELLEHLNLEWEILSSGDFRTQQGRYEAHLFAINQMVEYQENDQVKKGLIIGTTQDGRLSIQTETKKEAFLPKSIKLFY